MREWLVGWAVWSTEAPTAYRGAFGAILPCTNTLVVTVPLPTLTSCAPVSEEKQKEEVQRSALSALQRVSMTHRSPSQLGSGRLSPLPSAGAEGAAAADVAVPFTRITLVCRNIR